MTKQLMYWMQNTEKNIYYAYLTGNSAWIIKNGRPFEPWFFELEEKGYIRLYDAFILEIYDCEVQQCQ